MNGVFARRRIPVLKRFNSSFSTLGVLTILLQRVELILGFSETRIDF